MKIGDVVRWTSSNVEKIGVIVAIVPAGQRPADVGYPKAGGGGLSRDKESYIVRGAPTYAPKRKANYWPLNNLLVPEC